MSENEKLREAWAKFDLWFFRECNEGTRRHLFALFGLPTDEICNHGRERHALRFIREALSTPPSKADADDVERVAFAIIEGSGGVRAAEHAKEFQTANWHDALRSARTVLSAIQNRDAGLREVSDAAAHLIECLDAVRRGVPVRNLDEAWERYGNARAALQMGGEKP